MIRSLAIILCGIIAIAGILRIIYWYLLAKKPDNLFGTGGEEFYMRFVENLFPKLKRFRAKFLAEVVSARKIVSMKLKKEKGD